MNVGLLCNDNDTQDTLVITKMQGMQEDLICRILQLVIFPNDLSIHAIDADKAMGSITNDKNTRDPDEVIRTESVHLRRSNGVGSKG